MVNLACHETDRTRSHYGQCPGRIRGRAVRQQMRNDRRIRWPSVPTLQFAYRGIRLRAATDKDGKARLGLSRSPRSGRSIADRKDSTRIQRQPTAIALKMAAHIGIDAPLPRTLPAPQGAGLRPRAVNGAPLPRCRGVAACLRLPSPEGTCR